MSDSIKTPEQLRAEYEARGLDAPELSPDPFEQFEIWFQLAVKHCPGSWLEPNAMTLSTASSQTGLVTNRTVLLKQHDQSGFVFFTNYRSEKGIQLGENPQAALLFHWAYLGRQVRIDGRVTRTSRELSESYFHSRSRASQLGALASSQSRELPSRAHLETLARQLSEKYEGQPVPLPQDWGGFRLIPQRFEFWQGRDNRLHDRFRYVPAQPGGPADRQWQITRLFP